MRPEAPFVEDDLRILAIASKALNRDDPQAPGRLVDTLAALRTLTLAPEIRFSRGIQALRISLKASTPERMLEGLYQPFWNLGPDQRLALALLHVGRSTWNRVAASLGLSDTGAMGVFLWSARQELVFRSGSSEIPGGPSHPGPECPNYDPAAPWAQKFFDEEFSPSERIFIERHLQNCTSCSEHLARVRIFYYQADKVVRDALDLDHLAIPSLQFLNPDPVQTAFKELFKRWDVWLAIVGFVTLLAYCH